MVVVPCIACYIDEEFKTVNSVYISIMLIQSFDSQLHLNVSRAETGYCSCWTKTLFVERLQVALCMAL